MVRAYLFIQAAMGKPGAVAEALRGLPEVKSAVVVTGPYDVIALIEASDLQALGRVITEKIQTLEGVERTLTSLVTGI
ncbi:MAG: Lrp/AsnC ligand binding domain-containing protein [Thermoflexus sp.]|jgi:DNA-binding Lrp family transcriptional regulator|nr:Lrp/AsnC ligand binding domain-containing protein [Thermoflexus sp.]